MERYWIGVASRDHVQAAIRGGFAQLGHGKAAPARRLSRGDWIIYYSPRTALKSGDPVQAFTALGQVIDDSPHQVEQTADFHPYRLSVRFQEAREIGIRSLLAKLTFTRGRDRWGMQFRRGSFEIARDDFLRIGRAMGVKVAAVIP
jgi:hypothetical protein